jgi:hypothetical protein
MPWHNGIDSFYRKPSSGVLRKRRKSLRAKKKVMKINSSRQNKSRIFYPIKKGVIGGAGTPGLITSVETGITL